MIFQWDVKVQYSRQPLALHGGYEDWLLKYPAFTTNPQCVPPRQDDFMDDMLGMFIIIITVEKRQAQSETWP